MQPTSFERSPLAVLRGTEKVVIRQQRERLLPRILEFARLTIDDVVNDPRAKLAVRGWYRAADACEWESCRTYLAERIERQGWIRRNR